MGEKTVSTFGHEDNNEHPVWALVVKRILDTGFSFVVLIVILPLLLIAAVAVKLSGPGPVLYRGVRTGLSGRPFRIFKFRTMVKNAEFLGGPTTGTNDHRVTGVGKLLRRTKIDELPQLLNVLRGDMSLVGPRPEVLEYSSEYTGEGKCILSMRPGITDYASIEFADLDDLVGNKEPDKFFREKILPRKNALRIRYVKEWSLMSDFCILWATFCKVLRRIAVR